MTTAMKTLTIALTIFSHIVAFAANPGYRKGTATIAEVHALPQFCWWEYDERLAHTQSQLGDCGVGTNHYCPAYVDFLRAQSALDRRKKLRHLAVAQKEVEYTLKWVYERKNCPVRAHALATYNNIRMMYKILGVQLPPPKYVGP